MENHATFDDDLQRMKQSVHSSEQSPQPIYQKVKEFIEQQIASGAWQPDTKIPSENQIVEVLWISRMTVQVPCAS